MISSMTQFCATDDIIQRIMVASTGMSRMSPAAARQLLKLAQRKSRCEEFSQRYCDAVECYPVWRRDETVEAWIQTGFASEELILISLSWTQFPSQYILSHHILPPLIFDATFTRGEKDLRSNFGLAASMISVLLGVTPLYTRSLWR